MRHSIHTQHTKSSRRLPSSSVSSGVSLVAINKLLNECHDVNGAPASNNVIPRKYIPIHSLLILLASVYGALEHFLLVRNIPKILSTPSTRYPSHCRLPVNYTIHLRLHHTFYFVSISPHQSPFSVQYPSATKTSFLLCAPCDYATVTSLPTRVIVRLCCL